MGARYWQAGIVLALTMTAASAEADDILTCDRFDEIRSEADNGVVGSLGFLRGWMSGVMNMAGAQLEVEKRGDGRMTFCPTRDPYMSYDGLLAIYDKMMQDPKVSDFRQKNPGLCAPETVVLLGFQREFPCK